MRLCEWFTFTDEIVSRSTLTGASLDKRGINGCTLTDKVEVVNRSWEGRVGSVQRTLFWRMPPFSITAFSPNGGRCGVTQSSQVRRWRLARDYQASNMSSSAGEYRLMGMKLCGGGRVLLCKLVFQNVLLLLVLREWEVIVSSDWVAIMSERALEWEGGTKGRGWLRRLKRFSNAKRSSSLDKSLLTNILFLVYSSRESWKDLAHDKIYSADVWETSVTNRRLGFLFNSDPNRLVDNTRFERRVTLVKNFDLPK